jgi:hypothetical protein
MVRLQIQEEDQKQRKLDLNYTNNGKVIKLQQNNLLHNKNIKIIIRIKVMRKQ